jgi:hypothetical protein
MAVTLESIATDIAELKQKIEAIYQSNNVQIYANQMAQQKLQNLQMERSLITQLQMEGFTKAEALAYYQRMLNGEKPWLDNLNKE